MTQKAKRHLFEPPKSDLVCHQNLQIVKTEVITTDRLEACEWVNECYLELLRQRSTSPDLLCLGDDIIVTWETHFHPVRCEDVGGSAYRQT